MVVLNGHSSWEIKKISKVPQESKAHLHSKYFNHYSDPLLLQGTETEVPSHKPQIQDAHLGLVLPFVTSVIVPTGSF